MRRVLLQRPAFLGNALCERGSIVEIADGAELADYMTPVPDVTHGAPAALAGKMVTVHAHRATGDIDIDVGGVEMHIDHAALKVERD